MRRTISFLLLAFLFVLVAHPASAFLPDLNQPGWVSYASVTGWMTNWPESPGGRQFWQVRFTGTLYVNPRLDNVWCIDATGVHYDINKKEIPNSTIQVQFRYVPETRVVEVRRGFQPEGIWYGLHLRVRTPSCSSETESNAATRACSRGAADLG
jgi:hypothetical protein